jgi:hypothetical protein
MGTGESATGSAITAAGTEKNGYATIGVGTQIRFSSSRISRGTMLPLITLSFRKTVCLIFTILMYLSGQ